MVQVQVGSERNHPITEPIIIPSQATWSITLISLFKLSIVGWSKMVINGFVRMIHGQNEPETFHLRLLPHSRLRDIVRLWMCVTLSLNIKVLWDNERYVQDLVTISLSVSFLASSPTRKKKLKRLNCGWKKVGLSKMEKF